MSIYARVSAEFAKQRATREDDLDMGVIIAQLTPAERETWLDECDLEEELRPIYGHLPDFSKILEREIVTRGIERSEAA